MLRLTRVSPALLLLALIFFASVEARADAIAITSGSFDATAPGPFDRFRSDGFNFAGNNLSLRGSDGDGHSQTLKAGCFSCLPGQSFYVSHTGGLFTSLPSALLQFNGQSYVGWAGGALNFVTDEFVVPNTGESVITLTGHFTMTGGITFQQHFEDGTVLTPFFVSDVYGSGLVTLKLEQAFGKYYLTSVKYDFQPTPEPTTLVLLGSGIAGLAARQRRRSRLRKIQKEVS